MISMTRRRRFGASSSESDRVKSMVALRLTGEGVSMAVTVLSVVKFAALILACLYRNTTGRARVHREPGRSKLGREYAIALAYLALWPLTNSKERCSKFF